MNTQRLLISALLILLSFSATSGDEPWVVRQDGAGPVRIGMTLDQLNKALDEKFAAPAAKERSRRTTQGDTKRFNRLKAVSSA